MHNISSVIRFEIFRALKKPSFWIAAIAFPLVYVAMFGLGQIQGQESKRNHEKLASEKFSFQITDESKIIPDHFIESFGGKLSNDKKLSIEKVKKNEIDAYYFIPKNIKDDKIEIYAKNDGILNSGKYTAVLGAILKNASNESVDPNKISIINNSYSTETKFYKNGKEYNQIKEMVVPGIFFAVFYFIVAMFSSRMLTSTTEEKENRVTEMILTSISAKTMILGKIISLIALAFVQVIVITIPIIIIGKILGANEIFSLFADVKFSFWPILTSTLIFITGFLMITGLIVALGAAMPTAQEAGQFVGFVILLLMTPFFVSSSFLASEPNLVVRIMSFFPLTSPIALLARNTLGTLTPTEAIIGISLLAFFSVIAIWLAVRIFQFGTISYGKRVQIKNLLAKKKTA